jgi:hypothetical protein
VCTNGTQRRARHGARTNGTRQSRQRHAPHQRHATNNAGTLATNASTLAMVRAWQTKRNAHGTNAHGQN